MLRQLTVGDIGKIKRYVYLKNGAMYSVLFLGLVMVLEDFHVEVPEYVSPVATLIIIVFFFVKSKLYAKNNAAV